MWVLLKFKADVHALDARKMSVLELVRSLNGRDKCLKMLEWHVKARQQKQIKLNNCFGRPCLNSTTPGRTMGPDNMHRAPTDGGHLMIRSMHPQYQCNTSSPPTPLSRPLSEGEADATVVVDVAQEKRKQAMVADAKARVKEAVRAAARDKVRLAMCEAARETSKDATKAKQDQGGKESVDAGAGVDDANVTVGTEQSAKTAKKAIKTTKTKITTTKTLTPLAVARLPVGTTEAAAKKVVEKKLEQEGQVAGTEQDSCSPSPEFNNIPPTPPTSCGDSSSSLSSARCVRLRRSESGSGSSADEVGGSMTLSSDDDTLSADNE